ncbi:MAG: rhomboid family intramembrane serine protease [Dehalococcoidia bacterium]|jgi:membrane associated rhomboid family serine protease|nr:rhomboid family intramembrane serine protease [Dehalococcoidia bacterium]
MNAIAFLIALNVMVFVFQVLRPGLGAQLSLSWFSFQEQPWRLVTSMFAHGGFYHLLFNMISLYFLGSFFLRLVGEGALLKVYFIGGAIAGLAFILMAPYSSAVGASGAVFAIGGALAIMAPKLPVLVFPLPVPVPLWGAMVFFLLFGFLISGIAWQAHLGGFLFGLAAGYYYKRRGRRPIFY